MDSTTYDPRRLQQRIAGSMKLVDVTCQLAALHSLDEILHTVTTSVCEALNCERASLYLFDEGTQELYTTVVTELEISEIRCPIDIGITGWVARHWKIANIPDPHIDTRWNSSIDRRTGFRTQSILAAPVVSSVNDRLLGVLQLLNKSSGPFDDFDEQLIQAFALHAATALERSAFMEETRRTREIEISLDMARSIQAGFLPARLPMIAGYEVAAWWKPAEAVGGDYYDLISLPDGRLGVVVADVSGHGVAASLIMASVRAMLHVLTRRYSDPDRILSLLAETISPDLHDERFITFLMVAFDPKTHEATYVNAGHGPALYFCRESKTFQQLRSTCLPMGFMMNFDVRCSEPIRLKPGDLLLIATDGAIELRNPQEELFGRERLEQLVYDNRRLPARDLLTILQSAVTDFHPDAHPPDDITLLLLERKLR